MDKIVAAGNMNTATWKRTSNPKKLKKPRISKPGNQNTIIRTTSARHPHDVSDAASAA